MFKKKKKKKKTTSQESTFPIEAPLSQGEKKTKQKNASI
jgi:hypothetical protein